MTYIDTAFTRPVTLQAGDGIPWSKTRKPLVLVVGDGDTLSDAFRNVCECLEVDVERVPSRSELLPLLNDRRPMAVVAEMDAEGQDGCHVLMTVARHDRSLPVLVFSGGDPAAHGAAEAVVEIWRLSAASVWTDLRGVGQIVDFLFRAGRLGNCMRLTSI